MDFSTINLDVLRSLPVAKLAPTYHLQKDPGNGCFGDPPGFPTYFTQAVYTARGSSPNKGASMVIRYEGVAYVVERGEWIAGDTWEKRRERYAALMLKLWNRPLYGTPRVRLWIRETYRHMGSCYMDDERLVAEKHDNGMIIFPVPSYRLKTFVDDPRFSNEWRLRERTAIDTYNAELCERAAEVCIPINHAAYRRVVKFYPEHRPDLKLINNPPEEVENDWWRTDAKPAPASTELPS